MENVTTIALSRLVAQSRALDVTAANIANGSSPGFRAGRTLFTAFLTREAGAAEPPGGASIAYTQDRATYRDSRAGPRSVTGNPLDIAIGNPDGWLTVATARGPRLTRAGHFALDANGAVVDMQGEKLLDANGQPLQTAPTDTSLTIAGDGTLSGQSGQIGRIGVVQPSSDASLSGEGGSLFATTAPTRPLADPQLVQGAVEESNVEPIQELNQMMQQMREFQFTTQMIQAESDRQSGAIDKITTKKS